MRETFRRGACRRRPAAIHPERGSSGCLLVMVERDAPPCLGPRDMMSADFVQLCAYQCCVRMGVRRCHDAGRLGLGHYTRPFPGRRGRSAAVCSVELLRSTHGDVLQFTGCGPACRASVGRQSLTVTPAESRESKRKVLSRRSHTSCSLSIYRSLSQCSRRAMRKLTPHAFSSRWYSCVWLS